MNPTILTTLTGGTHGTQWIGSTVTAVGAVAAMDPTILAALFGDKGPAIALIAAGLLTFIRGKVNTANINAQNPP